MGSVSAASYIYDLQLVSYVDAACLTILTYDTILNAGQEYQHIWKAKWGLINCLYLWTRYGTFVDTTISVLKRVDFNLDAPTCNGISKFNELFAGFGIGIAEIILMIRTYALYERSKKLLVFFLTLLLASGVGITAGDVTHWTADIQPVTLVDSCNLTSSSDITLICYYILLATETITVSLTLWKGFHTFTLTRSLGVERPSNLMLSFYRDGIIFYIAMLSILVVVVLFQTVGPISHQPGLKFVGDTPLRVMHTILACHLVIHVRAVALKGEVTSMRTRSALVFAHSQADNRRAVNTAI